MPHGSAEPDANLEFANKFAIVIDNVQLTAFEGCDMPELEHATVSYRTGIDPPYNQSSTGLRNDIDVPFRKRVRRGGVADLVELFEWWKAKDTDKRDGAIVQYGENGEEIIRYPFFRGWLIKFKPPSFDSNDADATAEFTMTMRVEDIDMEAA